MVKKPFFASTEPLFNFTIMQNGHKINSSKQQRGMCRTHTRKDCMGGITNEEKNDCRSYGCNDDHVSGCMWKQRRQF